MTYIEQASSCLSILARVALALASATRSSRIFENNIMIYSTAETALNSAWRWEAKQSITSSSLYEFIYPLLSQEYKLDKNSPEISALFSMVSAMYYTTWLADGYERLATNNKPSCLPNDIAEVSEDTLRECLEFSAQAAEDRSSEVSWQLNAVEQLIKQYGKNNPESLGVPISQQFFKDI